MNRNHLIHFKSALLLLGVLLMICACAGNSNKGAAPVEKEQSEPTHNGAEPAPPQGVQMANPASTNCVNNSGKLEIMDGENGQYGVCIFPDGTRCEEWRYFRKQCAPGECREISGICEE